jgi:DNA-directed RNA polymerase subunit RPC12/RpoP
MTYNHYSNKYETVCHRCGAETDDLYVLGQRDDGSEYERSDGSFGESDVYVCLDCLEADTD